MGRPLWVRRVIRLGTLPLAGVLFAGSNVRDLKITRTCTLDELVAFLLVVA